MAGSARARNALPGAYIIALERIERARAGRPRHNARARASDSPETTDLSGLTVQQGDITLLAVDAVVNAANERMLGGGGVDGAIHAAAGPGLRATCERVEQVRPGVRCPTGEARITPGFELPAAYVIHTVGPVWRGGGAGEDALLASCYRESLNLANARGLGSIAFPCISCGIYHFPPERASLIAVREVRNHLAGQTSVHSVTLVAFDDALFETLKTCIRQGD